MVAKSRIRIEDGIIEWFNGPEWDEVAEEEFDKGAEQIQMQMRQDAVWEDRTGDARAGLRAYAENNNGVVRVYLQHSVDYGFWLEVIQNGRFAIIGPTLEEHARRLTYNAIRRIRYARKGVEP